MVASGIIRGSIVALLGVVLVGCSSSGDATANVEKSCKAFADAGPQSVDTVGPFLDEMVAEAQAAAEVDGSYGDFAEATVVLRDMAINPVNESGADTEEGLEQLFAALETVEAVCETAG